MNDILNSFLLIYVGLFPIVNPVSGAPLFLSLTPHATPAERRVLATRVATNSFFLLLGSLFVGSHVLEFFGITLPAVRVGGGLVVVAFAWNLLNPTDSARAPPADGTSNEGRVADAFYPLTMPLTVGPGSISVAIALGSQRPKLGGGLAELAALGGGAVLGVLAIAATILLCYRSADRVVSALGRNATNVVMRLSAFILLCLGVQIIWNGYKAFMGGP